MTNTFRAPRRTALNRSAPPPMQPSALRPRRAVQPSAHDGFREEAPPSEPCLRAAVDVRPAPLRCEPCAPGRAPDVPSPGPAAVPAGTRSPPVRVAAGGLPGGGQLGGTPSSSSARPEPPGHVRPVGARRPLADLVRRCLSVRPDLKERPTALQLRDELFAAAPRCFADPATRLPRRWSSATAGCCTIHAAPGPSTSLPLPPTCAASPTCRT
jgi:hypothetical protein